MRTREEIEEQEMDFIENISSTKELQVRIADLSLEVLLDIRDLLANKDV